MELAQAIDYTQNPRGESSVGGFGNVSLSTVRDSGTVVNKKRSISSTWRGPSSSSNIAHLFNPVKRLKPSIDESPPGRASQLSAFRDKYNRENDEELFLSSAAKHWLVANKIMLREETFHLFPKLPQELQDCIWDFALSAPKQLTISNVVRPHRFYAGADLHDFHSHSRISLDFRNICLASRDAYSRFKQSRPPKFTYRNTVWMKNGYWNLEEDLVVLSDCYLYTMWDFAKDFRVELEKIRTLVIVPQQNLLWGIGVEMLETLRSFKNLEKVLLVWGYEYDTSSGKWFEKPESIESRDNSNPLHRMGNSNAAIYPLDTFLWFLQRDWPEWKMPTFSTLSSGRKH